MRGLSSWVLFLACGAAAGAHAEAPRVVASIQPLHSLVAAVMQGVAEPRLLVSGHASPHDYALRPSEARALREADVVFRVGPMLEGFLDKPLATLAAGTRVLNLVDANGIVLLEMRHGERWPAHDHAGAAVTHHHRDEQAPGAEHGRVDPHIWLDPDNAAAMLRAIRDALASADQPNATRYRDNAETALQRIAASRQGWRARLAPVRARPFVVYHDAFQYLEHHFGLNAIGAVTIDPERQPSAMHLRALLERMKTTGAVCVFGEPQFQPALVGMILESSGGRAASLDPLGAGITPGADAWFTLMDANIASLADCLSRDWPGSVTDPG